MIGKSVPIDLDEVTVAVKRVRNALLWLGGEGWLALLGFLTPERHAGREKPIRSWSVANSLGASSSVVRHQEVILRDTPCIRLTLSAYSASSKDIRRLFRDLPFIPRIWPCTEVLAEKPCYFALFAT